MKATHQLAWTLGLAADAMFLVTIFGIHAMLPGVGLRYAVAIDLLCVGVIAIQRFFIRNVFATIGLMLVAAGAAALPIIFGGHTPDSTTMLQGAFAFHLIVLAVFAFAFEEPPPLSFDFAATFGLVLVWILFNSRLG